jgi:hypothetical protein
MLHWGRDSEEFGTLMLRPQPRSERYPAEATKQ